MIDSFGIMLLSCGGSFLAGAAVAMACVSLDKRIVTLLPGQTVIDAEQREKLVGVEKLEKNPLKHNPRAKVKPPEDDFGDDDDDDVGA